MPSTTPGSKTSGFRWDNANSRLGIWALGAEVLRMTASGLSSVLPLRSISPSAAMGYGTGSGSATVTQATNRTTGVTITTVTGSITTNNTSLAAEAAAEFTVTATGLIAINDVVVVSIQSGTNGGNTDVFVSTVAADSFKIKVSNNNAAAGTAETGAIIINYAIIKGSAS